MKISARSGTGAPPACHRHERTRPALGRDVVLRVERGQPDHLPPPAVELHHLADCLGVDAADGPVQDYPTEDLETLDLRHRQRGTVGRHREVILQHNATQTGPLGHAGYFQIGHRSRTGVGARVHVEVDGAGERDLLALGRASADPKA